MSARGNRRQTTFCRAVIATGEIQYVCRGLPLWLLLASPVAWADASAVCQEHWNQAAYIMDARLEGVRRQELAADLAGGGPPPPRLIRLIKEVYELPIDDLSGAARADRLDQLHADCLQREGG